MLVLTRKCGEAIVVDGKIRIEVAKVSGKRVRLLVDAPRDVIVDRGETWARRQSDPVCHGALPQG